MTAKVVPIRQVMDGGDTPQPVVLATDAVRLNLGCNQRPKPGYINVDIEKFPGVDVVTDLEKPWPWADNSVDEVGCADLPEHIRQSWDEYDFAGATDIHDVIAAIQKPRRVYGIIHFMNEAWRVLKPGGLLNCTIPSTDVAGRGAWQDPTHVSYWNENTLLYFCDVAGNYRGLYPHLITAKFKPRQIRTYMPNAQQVTYLCFVLEKLA